MSTPCLHLTDLWLADGSEKPLIKSELYIENGIIKAVGKDNIGTDLGRKISCRGAIAAPGFIDVHGHSDISSLASESALWARCQQGVTCEIAGNCGLSAFPVTENNQEHLEKLYAKYNVPFSWRSYAEYKKFSAEKNILCDLEHLTGHNTLRAAVCGYGKYTDISSRQLNDMGDLLENSYLQGALGLSLGLLYVPGKFASPDELHHLFKITAKHNKIITCHLRSEGKKLLESIEEMITLSLESGLKKLHISHFKTAGKDNFHKLDAALEMFDYARQEGLSVTFDRYPYTRSMTQLSLVLPDEWCDIDDVTITKKLQDNELCRQLTNELRTQRGDEYWKSVILVNSPLSKYRSKHGCTLADLGNDPAECIIEILRHDSAGATAAFSGMSSENMLKIITDKYCMAGSDGTALPPDGSFGTDHPRSYGAVCRFIRLLLDNGVSIENAVRKVTGFSADTFGLNTRGYIRENLPADIVIFDPDSIDGKSDFANPSAQAQGIIKVLKNGCETM